jgi:hypothetical protein
MEEHDEGLRGAEGQGQGYSAPVARLVHLEDEAAQSLPDGDYRALGLGEAHVDELRAFAREYAPLRLDNSHQDSPEYHAAAHAWLALMQIDVEAAVETMLELLPQLRDDEWLHSDFLEAAQRVGPALLPRLRAFLEAEANAPAFEAVVTVQAMIAERHPEVRDEVVAALVPMLEQAESNDQWLNAVIIEGLVRLRAIEAVDVIERAYAADAVDMMFVGDWNDVQVDLGLKEPPPPKSNVQSSRVAPPPRPEPFTTSKKPRTNSRRQMQKQSRKQNRKRK